MYRPKTDKTTGKKVGLAAQLQINGDACYLKLARQEESTGEYDKFSWQKKGETSDGTKNLNVKLGLADIGSVMSVFCNRQEKVTLFHKFMNKDNVETTTVIEVAKYLDATKVTKGYSVNVSKGKEKYGFIVGHGEVEILRTLLTEAVLGQSVVTLKSE
jgi:hypothetical protein